MTETQLATQPETNGKPAASNGRVEVTTRPPAS